MERVVVPERVVRWFSRNVRLSLALESRAVDLRGFHAAQDVPPNKKKKIEISVKRSASGSR